MSKGKEHCLDGGRAARAGIPEVVFAPSKSERALVETVAGLARAHDVLVTKCDASQVSILKKRFGTRVLAADEEAGVVIVRGACHPLRSIKAKVAVVSAGSSDRFVAEEAALSLEYLGLEALRLYDRGVAGLHRVRGAARECARKGARAAIVVAGMEGTLPSVMASLVKVPVIAVPTSVGYGTGAGGLTALSTMLNSCSPGVLVVNIDNGFGAAAAVRKFIDSGEN